MSVPAEHVTQARVLAIVGMLNAAIGGWYYLRIIAVMYLRSPLRTLFARKTVRPWRRWRFAVRLPWV